MHPAFSVIFLTTLIGVGQGLFLALYTGQIYSTMKLLSTQDSQNFYAIGSLLAVIFLILGLLASFFHLGHPERGWRAISRWRTSWLSREVIILPNTLFLIALYGLAHYLNWTQPLFTLAENTYPIDFTLLLGALATLATFALFICTGMIYACLKFLSEWHNPLTVTNYILLGSMSGFTLAAAFSAFVESDLVDFYAMWAMILTVMAFLSRGASLLRHAHLKLKSNLQTAIGVRHTAIIQKAQGAMCGSFNTREFFHHQSENQLTLLKILFLNLVFVIPFVLLSATVSGWFPLILSVIAFVLQYIGLLIERWYFFAEAKHPQNLFYQSVG